MKWFSIYSLAALFTGLVQWVGARLKDIQGATARDSTLYTNLVTNKYVPDARERDGRLVPIYFSATFVSATATGDTYKLCVLPKGWQPFLLHATTDGISASGAVNSTVKIGDSGDDDRYMPATDFDVAAAQFTGLAFAGVGYRPTADTVVLMTITGAHTAGKIVKGSMLCVPGS